MPDTLPPTLRRGYDYTSHSVARPAEPPPGDRIDADLDNLFTAIRAMHARVEAAFARHAITEEMIHPDLLANIKQACTPEETDAPARTTAAAHAALYQAGRAASEAARAEQALAEARNVLHTLGNFASEIEQSAKTAEARAAKALDDATLTENRTNDAEGFAYDSERWAGLSGAWAEYLNGNEPIPPAYFAHTAVTGDHWSSRWWANRAGEIVDGGIDQIICAVQMYWMGAYANDPVLDLCGLPIAAGAAYFNTTLLRTRVYDGSLWHDLIDPVPGVISSYVYLPATPTQVFTGIDANGNALECDPVATETEVFLNGVKLIRETDYSVQVDQVTMLLGTVTAPNVVEIVVTQEINQPIPRIGRKVDTAGWVFDGVQRSFPLDDGAGGTLDPASATDCQLSLNGSMQDPGIDFNVAGSTVTFAVPPQADADRWMVCGIAAGAATPSAIIAHQPTPPVAPAHASLWSRTDGDLFVFDGVLAAWIQLSGYAA